MRILAAVGLAALTPIAASAETLIFGTGAVERHPLNQRYSSLGNLTPNEYAAKMALQKQAA